MRVLLLAAGFGTRLNEIGQTTPKGLLKFAGTTIFDKTLNDLIKTSNISEIGVVTNQRFYTQYLDHIYKTYPDKKILVLNDEVNEPEKRKGALGDLLFSIDKLNWEDADLFVLPSDTYYSFEMNDFLGFYERHKGSFVTIVRKFEDLDEIKNKLGCATMDGEKIIDFVEKPNNPSTPYAAIPFYIYPKELLPLIKVYQEDGGNMDTPGSIIPWLISRGIPIYAYIVDGKTIDIGTPEDFARLQQIS